MLSFFSYFLLKKPARQDFLAAVASFVAILGASDTGFVSVFAAVVFGLVVFATVLLDFADDFGFFVAIVSSFNDINYIIAQFLVYNENMAIMMNREDDKNQELTARIQADLRARAKKTKDLDEDEDFDVYVFSN